MAPQLDLDFETAGYFDNRRLARVASLNLGGGRMLRTVMSGRSRWLVLSVVAVMLLGACGDDDDSSTSDDAPSQVTLLAGVNDQQDPNLVITEFLPEAVTVRTGAAVQWRFSGPEPHSVTFLAAG